MKKHSVSSQRGNANLPYGQENKDLTSLLGFCYIKKVIISNYVNYLFTTEGGEWMSLVQVREKAQITIPSKIRKALNIKEGDYLEALVEDNKIVFVPKVLIDKAEPVVLSKKGEEMLKEALEDVKKGRVKKFKNVEELIDDLHK